MILFLNASKAIPRLNITCDPYQCSVVSAFMSSNLETALILINKIQYCRIWIVQSFIDLSQTYSTGKSHTQRMWSCEQTPRIFSLLSLSNKNFNRKEDMSLYNFHLI